MASPNSFNKNIQYNTQSQMVSNNINLSNNSHIITNKATAVSNN